MRYIRWALAWALYWLGDIVSHINRLDIPGLYSVYSWLMVTSDRIQGQTDFGPWKTVKAENGLFTFSTIWKAGPHIYPADDIARYVPGRAP